MADPTELFKLAILKVGTPSEPVNTLVNGGVLATDTQIFFAFPVTKADGSTLTERCLIAVEDNKTKFIEIIGIDPGDWAADKKSANNIDRGIEPSGSDFSVGNPDFAVDLPEGSRVGVPVSSQQMEMVVQALLGDIGATLKFNTRPTYQDAGVASAPSFAGEAAADAAIGSPINGDRFYDSVAGVHKKREGGGWVLEGSATTPNASDTVTGKVRLNDAAQTDAATDIESGDPTVNVPSETARVIQQSKYTHLLATGAVNTFAVTLVPAITAYVDGQELSFEANLAVTGASTVNFNGVGVLNIKVNADIDTVADDIKAGQMVTGKVNGTTFEMTSQLGNAPLTSQFAPEVAILTSSRSWTAATGSQAIAHGLSKTPKYVHIIAQDARGESGFGISFNCNSHGYSDGSVNKCSFLAADAEAKTQSDGTDATEAINMQLREDGGSEDQSKQEANITLDGTNVTLNWTRDSGLGTPGTVAGSFTFMIFVFA